MLHPGTTDEFEVTVSDPAEDRAVTAQNPSLPEASGMIRPVSVLHVDDEAMFRKIFWDHFHDAAKCLVVSCATVKDAYDALASQTFDVILADLHMPDMSGIDFLVDVKKRYGVSQGEGYILTANEAVQMRSLVLARGIDGYIPKSRFERDVKRLIDRFAADLQEDPSVPG